MDNYFKFYKGQRVKIIDDGYTYSSYDIFVDYYASEYKKFFKSEEYPEDKQYSDEYTIVGVGEHLDMPEEVLYCIFDGKEVIVIGEKGLAIVEQPEFAF